MDLASTIDAKMTRWRSELNLGSYDAGQNFNPATVTDFWYTDVDVNKGWVEFDIQTQWYAQGGCAAGWLHAKIDGALCRTWVFHNDCKGTNIEMPVGGSVAAEFPSGKKGVRMALDIDVAGNGSTLLLTSVNVLIRQFGAG